MSKQELTLFSGELDRYNGITVDSQKEHCDTNNFSNNLKVSLEKWSEDKRRCIWFKINIKDSAWVPVLADAGFNFHHAQNDSVTMYKWLPTDCSSNLPPSCHTNLGVGGMVFNENNELLVVSEKHYEYPHWKLPGGYVERGEDIKDAAIREVKEETGIDAVFDSMVTLRHTHRMMFGNSDIYVVVRLRATSAVIDKSEIEIMDCKWMNIDEYLSHPHVHEFNRFLVRQALELDRRGMRIDLNKFSYTINKTSRDVTALTLEDAVR